EDMELVRIEKASRSLVANEGIVLPGVPEPANDVGEFFRSSVAVGRSYMHVAAKILGLERLHGGDEIPAGPAAADRVESRKPARDMIRLVVRGGRRTDQPDMGGHRRQRREQRDGLEARDKRRHAKIVRVVLTGADDVCRKQHVEQTALRNPSNLNHVREIDVRGLGNFGMAPGGNMVPMRLDKGAQPHFALLLILRTFHDGLMYSRRGRADCARTFARGARAALDFTFRRGLPAYGCSPCSASPNPP